MKLIQKRKYFYVFSASLVLASLVLFFTWGLKLGIDFTGGVLMEVGFENQRPTSQAVIEVLKDSNIRSLSVQPSNSGSMLLRFVSEQDNASDQVISKLKEAYPDARANKVDFISSVISGELKTKAFYAIALAVLGIALYIAWAFKKVSYPVSSYKYGITAVIALFHDIIITVGVFVVLGRFWGVEVNVSFIAALLTILGYSVNDTIVVFDRVRENLLKAGAKDDFEGTVNKSILDTFGRSINTSMTVMIVLLAIILFGGESIKYFALALLIGVFYGTYSSIFVASSLLVDSQKIQIKR